MSAQTQQYEVKAGLQQIEAFAVAGISCITQRDKAAEDINALWERFFSGSVGQMIQDKESDIIYCVYSDYEGDFEQPFKVTIGYKLKSLDGTTNGAMEYFDTIQVENSEYAMMSAGGEQPKALLETWEAIWSSDLERTYMTDFEVYGPRFFEQGVNEVLVCVGVKS